MRIISNFQDYYDSIQQYGIDNKIVFNRINKHQSKFNTEPTQWFLSSAQNEISDLRKRTISPHIENEDTDMAQIFMRYENSSRFTSNFNYSMYQVIAVINGKAYENYIITKTENYQERIIYKNPSAKEAFDILKDNVHLMRQDGFTQKEFASYKDHEDYLSKMKSMRRNYFGYRNKNTSNTTQEEMYKLHKELDTPVFFLVNNGSQEFVVSNVPLAYLGFNKLFDGNIEVVSQEISYCIGNILKNNNEPPIAIDDKVKIEQHGFDKKKSFRHR